jgi:H+/Cl- antiporter ClcA
MANRPHMPAPQWTIGLPFKLALAGVAVGIIGRLFVATLKMVRMRTAHWFHWPPVRAVVGGAATLGLMALVGRDYLGLSNPLVAQAFSGAHVHIWVPFLKLVFTAIALGTGFVGGEVAPLFVMGSALGAAIAPSLHTPSPLLATTGSAAAFASAASVAITGVVLTVEQFGWHTFIPALIVGLFARVAAGRPGLYIAH